MISPKIIFRFSIRCVLVYGLLLLLAFVGLENYYSLHFKSVGNQLARPIVHWGLIIQFQENQGADQTKYDMETVLMNKDSLDRYTEIARKQRKVNYIDVPAVNIAFNSFRQGLLPTILVLALILASPIRFRWRKLRAILVGMILIHCYILFKLIIRILNACHTNDALGVAVAESPFGKEMFYYLYLIFIVDMPMRIIVPILIWILVSFRKEDLLRFVDLKPLENDKPKE